MIAADAHFLQPPGLAGSEQAHGAAQLEPGCTGGFPVEDLQLLKQPVAGTTAAGHQGKTVYAQPVIVRGNGQSPLPVNNFVFFYGRDVPA